MKEYIGQLPPEVEKLYEEVRRPITSHPPRVFIPTRPTLLRPGESVRIFALVVEHPHHEHEVQLLTRVSGAKPWASSPMKQLGRQTYKGELNAPRDGSAFLDYFVRAKAVDPYVHPHMGGQDLTCPPQAPEYFYTVTVA